MRGERAASSPERPEGPFWRYSPASKARGVSGLGNGRHPAITDEREERERVSRYRVVARRTWVCATVSWLRLADRLGWGGTISLDPAEGGWPTDGQHVNVRRQAKHGQARGAGRGLVRRVVEVVRPPAVPPRRARTARPGNRACTNARPTGPRRASCTCLSMAISDTVMSCLMTRRQTHPDSAELHPPPRTDPTHTGGPAPRDARPDRNRTTCL